MRLEQLPGVRDHVASTMRAVLGGPGQPRLDREGYHAFQAGFIAGLSW